MSNVIDKKINELKEELAKQIFTEEDNEEIERQVEEFRNDLIEEKENEYTYNKEIINAKIEALEEVKSSLEDEEVVEEKEPEKEPEVVVTPTINPHL